VRVRVAPDLDARLPAERPVRVTVSGPGGTRTVEAPNPVGDADHHPFDRAGVVTLLTGLLGEASTVDALRTVVDDLPGLDAVGARLRALADL
jgi:hypothetical protein